MERKQLTASQQVAFRTLWSRFQQAQQELTGMVNEIAREHDIPQEEFSQWRISEDAQWLKKVGQGKPIMKIPQGKKGKKEKKDGD